MIHVRHSQGARRPTWHRPNQHQKIWSWKRRSMPIYDAAPGVNHVLFWLCRERFARTVTCAARHQRPGIRGKVEEDNKERSVSAPRRLRRSMLTHDGQGQRPRSALRQQMQGKEFTWDIGKTNHGLARASCSAESSMHGFGLRASGRSLRARELRMER